MMPPKNFINAKVLSRQFFQLKFENLPKIQCSLAYIVIFIGTIASIFSL